MAFDRHASNWLCSQGLCGDPAICQTSQRGAPSDSPWTLCTCAQLVQALEWCLELGVPCVSVYAFSLENFNRSAAEVAVLMDLAERKLLAILQVVMRPQRCACRLHIVPAAATHGQISMIAQAVALWSSSLLLAW